jgi:hypothetical protein
VVVHPLQPAGQQQDRAANGQGAAEGYSVTVTESAGGALAARDSWEVVGRAAGCPLLLLLLTLLLLSTIAAALACAHTGLPQRSCFPWLMTSPMIRPPVPPLPWPPVLLTLMMLPAGQTATRALSEGLL